MKPIPIPDALIPPHYRRLTIGAPIGEENDIRPVEALIPANVGLEGRKYVMLIQIEEEDREHLEKSGGLFWLQILGTQLSPFSVDVVTGVEVE